MESMGDAFGILYNAAMEQERANSNGIERLIKEIKRRTRVATLFPNEPSLLRLVSTVLVEIWDEWKTEKVYIRMEPE